MRLNDPSEMSERSKVDRRKLLERLLKRRLARIKKHPRVRLLLSEAEAEEGLNILINRIVENVLRKEDELGRELTPEEFHECFIKTLNEFLPKLEYIV